MPSYESSRKLVWYSLMFLFSVEFEVVYTPHRTEEIVGLDLKEHTCRAVSQIFIAGVIMDWVRHPHGGAGKSDSGSLCLRGGRDDLLVHIRRRAVKRAIVLCLRLFCRI